MDLRNLAQAPCLSGGRCPLRGTPLESFAQPTRSRDSAPAPAQIDWVRAAGNYVELRSHGHTIVHRSSIAAVERDLADHGFVRIHRSILVRRDRIARIRPQDVVLVDGTQLKIGKRYRSDLAA